METGLKWVSRSDQDGSECCSSSLERRMTGSGRPKTMWVARGGEAEGQHNEPGGQADRLGLMGKPDVDFMAFHRK